MIFLLIGLLTLASLGAVIALVVYCSKFIIKAAPLGMAVVLGCSYGWFHFFFWLIVLYALASYKKLRNAVVFVSISLAGSIMPAILIMFVGNMISDNVWILAFIKLMILLASIFLAFMVETEKVEPFCINIARILPLPLLIERIIMSILYGVGFAFIIAMSFVDAIGPSGVLGTIANIALIVGTVVTFFVDTKLNGGDATLNACLSNIKTFAQSSRQWLEVGINKLADMKKG